MTIFVCVKRRYKVNLGILLIVALVSIYLSHTPNKWELQSQGEPSPTAMIGCHSEKYRVLINECAALRGLGYMLIDYSRHVNTVDVLWTLDRYRTPPWLNVKANTVNHIRATTALYKKTDLVTAGNISVIPPAFILPAQTLQFQRHALIRLEKNSGALWIKKSFRHRGVKIMNVSDILSREKGGFLVQEYLADPLLISNRKFDFGVFSIVTSVSPLRFYLYTADFMTQFCLLDYLPFNPSIRGKYLKEDLYAKVWQITALKELAGTPGKKKDKDIMYKYLDNQGYDSSKLHDDIVAAASEIGCKREKIMASLVEKTLKTGTASSSRKSFELLRFDVSVQRDLSVRVIEINKTPITDEVDAHKGMFVRMLTSTMIMGGLVNSSWTKQKVAENTNVNTVTDAEVNVDHEGCNKCSAAMCETTWICRVCSLCLTVEDRKHFRKAVLEHRRQKYWTRIVPPPFKNQEAARKWNPSYDPLYQTLSRSTQIMALWYHRKCLTDAAWCS